MDAFFPFIHEKKDRKKDQSEPVPLYVELVPPAPEKKESSDEEDRPGVIIIELF